MLEFQCWKCGEVNRLDPAGMEPFPIPNKDVYPKIGVKYLYCEHCNAAYRLSLERVGE